MLEHGWHGVKKSDSLLLIHKFRPSKSINYSSKHHRKKRGFMTWMKLYGLSMLLLEYFKGRGKYEIDSNLVINKLLFYLQLKIYNHSGITFKKRFQNVDPYLYCFQLLENLKRKWKGILTWTKTTFPKRIDFCISL